MTTTTVYGDRWDLLAYDLLGDAALAPLLMEVNPQFVGLIHLPEGVEIIVPKIITTSPQVNRIKPPWQS